ncbi:hypothetical protein BGZ49_005994 [Haplosporangium sp. Z 27]|nr:hypothetical protein BGZ49_005994 [Haplosporangium sp. Z 27]
MSSTRFEARNQARAIPLVTVSLASGHLRQTRLANDINSSNNHSQARDHDQGERQEQPPSYDSIQQGVSNNNTEIATPSPSNKDLTDAVLHLSRTLVSASTEIPKRSSWLFMMIYSWTRTQQTTTQLYHILSKPTTFLKGIRGQNENTQLQQYKRQRKSIQQMTEEQDMMEDDPDMLYNATEMIPVTMMNTRNVASMEESLPEDPQEQDSHVDSSDDDSAIPRKPKRRIDKYRNPFGSGVNSEDELEDDEGWLGRGDERSEDGYTKTNSVLLTSTKLSHSLAKRAPEFLTPSLGPAMDPRQFEAERIKTGTSQISSPTQSLFNTPRSSIVGKPSSKTSQTTYATDAGISSSLTVSTLSEPPYTSENQQQQLERHPNLHIESNISVEAKDDQSEPDSVRNHLQPHPSLESPWSESSENSALQPQSLHVIPDIVLSTALEPAPFIDASTTEHTSPSPSPSPQLPFSSPSFSSSSSSFSSSSFSSSSSSSSSFVSPSISPSISSFHSFDNS